MALDVVANIHYFSFLEFENKVKENEAKTETKQFFFSNEKS